MTFIEKQRPKLESKGVDDPTTKASEMWRNLKPQLKKKLELHFQKKKEKYLADLTKYDYLMKNFEQKKININ